MNVRDVATWLRRPKYTGDNRCLPCTLLNLCIGGVLAAIIAIAWTPLLGVVVFAVSSITIYFRGYLVPGTPVITKRYFPTWVLRLFGTESVSSDRSVQGSTAGPVDDQLFTSRVLTRDGAEATITPEFRTDWTDRTAAVTEREVELTDLQMMFDAETVTRHGDQSFVIDGNKSVRWGSNAALVADIAAADLLRERLPGWATTSPDRRQSILRGLRLCLDVCPTCDGSLAVDEQRVDPCCDRPHLVAQSVCVDCSAVLADTAVVDSGVTSSVRAELLQS